MTVLAVLYVAVMTGFFYMLMSDEHHFLPENPVLYLYPQEERQLTVTLDLEGTLDTVYPAPDIQRTTERGPQASWTVTAAPDGTLTDQAGRTYPSLFWDGQMTLPDPDAGFVVSREDAVPFLEDKLAQLGLTDREADANTAVQTQTFSPPPTRTGFTAVEWGGAQRHKIS